MFCMKCGKENQGEGKFCCFCGAEIPSIKPVVNNVSNYYTNNNSVIEVKEYFIDYKKVKKYFKRKTYFLEIASGILIFISIILLMFNTHLFKYRNSGAFVVFMPAVAGVILICWSRYKSLYRTPNDSWYDDMSFKYKTEITNTAIKRCGVESIPKSDFKQIVFCGYSTDRVRRVKTGKDNKNRSEAPEITVLFFLKDHVRYYSTKIYTLKRKRVINNIGTILYKDIMSVNIGEDVIRTKEFTKLKIITLNGAKFDFAVGDMSEANMVIEKLTDVKELKNS